MALCKSVTTETRAKACVTSNFDNKCNEHQNITESLERRQEVYSWYQIPVY